jgi:hypothetical protein
MSFYQGLACPCTASRAIHGQILDNWWARPNALHPGTEQPTSGKQITSRPVGNRKLASGHVGATCDIIYLILDKWLTTAPLHWQNCMAIDQRHGLGLHQRGKVVVDTPRTSYEAPDKGELVRPGAGAGEP